MLILSLLFILDNMFLFYFQHVCRSATLASGAEMLGRTGLDFLFSRNCLLYKFLYIAHTGIQINSFGRFVRIHVRHWSAFLKILKG